MILGGGPNRIGQGIEFDYCCVHASFALREIGFETVMVNSNPETVSTDYDTSDRLYFEPLTLEDVLEIYEQEKLRGRHRPVRRPDAAQPRRSPEGERRATSSAPRPRRIDIAEDRKLFAAAARQAGPASSRATATARNARARRWPSAARSAIRCCCARRSCSAAGACSSSTTREELGRSCDEAVRGHAGQARADRQVPRGRDRAGRRLPQRRRTSVIGGMLEHIEYAGVHSGDAAMVMPPHTLAGDMLGEGATARRAPSPGAQRHRAHERPVRHQGARICTSWR